ncbi:MAG: acyltransferase family protein [Cyanobacteriota bacterium]|jgi:peptidoglycan/LPS O-acetylase OafA/YrhL
MVVLAPSPPGRPEGAYRADIDGLRAVAVLAVILFHFKESLLPSGFLGVDVFFVISGFVITGSLARHREARLRPFLLAFYARRVKRLLPLLIVCVLLTSLVGALVITPGSEEAAATWQTGIAALFGGGNLVLHARQFDYFAPATALNLFTHTWSLGVEEQFYLLFPFLVFASGFARGAPGGGRRLAWPLLVLSGASLVAWLTLNQRDPGWAYYLFPARFWEMAAGALAYLAWRARPLAPWLAPPLPTAPLALGLLALLALPKAFSSLATVGVVVVTALLLWGLAPGQITTRLLSAAPMRRIGLLSYALYLWHWSVLSLSAWTIGIHGWTVPIQVALILGLAEWSHRAIETPLRRASWGGLPRVTLLYGLLAVASSSLVVHLLGHRLQGRLFTGDLAQTQMVPWQRRLGLAGTSVTSENCHTEPSDSPGEFSAYARRCTTPPRPTDRLRLFVIGDSHALALMPLLDRLHQTLPLRITHYSRNGCPMPPSAAGHASSGCWTFGQRALGSVLAEVGPGDVVLAHNYFRSHFGEGEDTRSMQIDGRGRPIQGEADKVGAYGRALASLADALAVKGASLLIVADAPRFLALKVDANLCAKQWFRPWPPASCTTPLLQSRTEHDRDHRALHRLFARLEAAHSNVRVVDPADALCPRGVCRSHDEGGELLYRDRDHLNARGVGRLEEPLRALFEQRALVAPSVQPEATP